MAAPNWTLRWAGIQVLALLVLVGLAVLLQAIAPDLPKAVKLGVLFAALVLLSVGLFRMRARLFGDPPTETDGPPNPERKEN